MRRSVAPSARLVLVYLLAVVATTRSFAPSQSYVRTATWQSRRGGGLPSSLGGDEGLSSAQKKQEESMERASAAGAAEIAKLSLEERTKRAMLAEAVEDRIFELSDQLDRLVKRNGGVENLSEEAREEAVEMAKQTKALQTEYDDLVSGRPHQLLDMGTEGSSG